MESVHSGAGKVRDSKGAWATYTSAQRQRLYTALLEPDGEIYFAGEHCSYLTAWMAGAFESARYVVDKLHQRVSKG